MEITYNPDNETVTRRAFDPYGNSIGNVTATAPTGSGPGAWPDQRGFLDDPVDSATGLTAIGARQYDAAIGRFISADPLLDPSDPQSLTGYAYAGNNPVTDCDPSGLWSWGGIFRAVARVTNVVSTVAGMIPLCAVCQAISVGAGAISAGADFAGGDAKAGFEELGNVALSVACGGFGEVSKLGALSRGLEKLSGKMPGLAGAMVHAPEGSSVLAKRMFKAGSAWVTVTGNSFSLLWPFNNYKALGDAWHWLAKGNGHMASPAPAASTTTGHYVRFEIHSGLLAM
jgi:RHS repeat-associated protein